MSIEHLEIRKLSCSILLGNYDQQGFTPPLYNDVYQYWLNTWRDFFIKLDKNPDTALEVQNFLRQSFVIVLHEKHTKNIAGAIHTSLFRNDNLTIYDHAYIKSFPADTVNYIRSEKPGAFSTGEYLSVAPPWRKNLLGISLADVLIGLMLRLSKNLECIGTLATTVRQSKIHEICEKFSYEHIQKTNKYNLDIFLMYKGISNNIEHPTNDINTLIDYFWKNRNELFTQPYQENRQKQKETLTTIPNKAG